MKVTNFDRKPDELRILRDNSFQLTILSVLDSKLEKHFKFLQ